MEMIEHPPILHLPAIPDHILYTWIVMAILAVVAVVATRRLSLVPAGTQNEGVLKLAGMGLPRLDSERRGDQLVRVRVWVPKRLSAEERARLEELRASENLAPPGEEGGFWRKVKEAFTA